MGMKRLSEITTGDDFLFQSKKFIAPYEIGRLFAFKGNTGTAPANVVDSFVIKNPGAKAALDSLLSGGSIIRKGGDYIWTVKGSKEEGMSRLSGLLEAFKYTGDWEKDFEDAAVMPELIIDTAVDQNRKVPTEKREDIKKWLLTKFASVYKANQRWAEEILNGRGNKGRDSLYAFVNHWIDGAVASAEKGAGPMA